MPVVEIENDADVVDAVAPESLDNGDLIVLLFKPRLAVIVESHCAADFGGGRTPWANAAGKNDKKKRNPEGLR